ncbi:MAG: RDD family protein [Streptosporangiaceae bacterium]
MSYPPSGPPNDPGYPQGQTPPPPAGTSGNHIMLDRFLARLVDGLVLLIPALILSAISNSLFRPTINLRTGETGGSEFLMYFVSGLLMIALYIGYETYFLGTQGGQTVGKKLLKLRVIREDGRPLDVNTALHRAGALYGGMVLYLLGGVLVLLPTLGGLIVLGVALSPFADSASGRYQGLHDKFAKTLVVKSA